MGFAKSTTTGAVDTSKVFEGGRHWLGPAQEFKSYPSTAHIINMNKTAVFTSVDKLEVGSRHILIRIYCNSHYKDMYF